MMSLSAIADLSAAQARKAAHQHKQPFIVELSDLDDYKAKLVSGGLHLPFPNIGDYRPRQWALVDYWTIAKFDIGGGPAISIRDLIEKLLAVGRGYAIIEEGEFQLVIGEFIRSKGR